MQTHLTKKGVDYCGAGHQCHARAQCINLQTTYACHCLPGYTGDGKNCTGKYICHHLYKNNPFI